MPVAANQRWSLQTVAVKLRFYCTESECNVHNMYQDPNSYFVSGFFAVVHKCFVIFLSEIREITGCNTCVPMVVIC